MALNPEQCGPWLRRHFAEVARREQLRAEQWERERPAREQEQEERRLERERKEERERDERVFWWLFYIVSPVTGIPLMGILYTAGLPPLLSFILAVPVYCVAITLTVLVGWWVVEAIRACRKGYQNVIGSRVFAWVFFGSGAASLLYLCVNAP